MRRYREPSIHRGIVVSKTRARDIESAEYVYVLSVLCEDDGACEDDLVVSKEMYDSACIAGLGQDTIVEYGTVLRFVTGPGKTS